MLALQNEKVQSFSLLMKCGYQTHINFFYTYGFYIKNSAKVKFFKSTTTCKASARCTASKKGSSKIL